MADLPSTFTAIQVEETKFQASCSNSVWVNMGQSINFLLDNLVNQLGQYQWSSLTIEQFQEQRGDSWVLADGRDIIGSDLNTLTGDSNIPDCRGRFLRGANSSGALIEDSNPSHRHVSSYADKALGTGGLSGLNLPSSKTGIFSSSASLVQTSSAANAGTSGSTGGDEFRPKNISMNLFVKINIL